MIPNMDCVTQIKAQLAATVKELHELSTTSYSQSNAGHMLALRSLQRKRARLEAAINQLEVVHPRDSN
jgi:hypothetical protein